MSVYWPTGRNCYYCQWRDPLTGKKKTLSTGKTDKWEANQFAADQASKLSGDALSVVSVSWDRLCEEYKADRFQSQRKKTQQKTEASMRAVADLMDNPTDMLHFGTAQVRKFKRLLRQRSISDQTVNGHLRELRKILRWAHKNHMLKSLPHFELPKLIPPQIYVPTDDDLQSMLKVTPGVVGEAAAPSWIHLLEGLWWSGLRLSEAECIQWTGKNFAIMWLDIDKDLPMFHLAATKDKKCKTRVFTVAPDFVQFLRQTPEKQRVGYIFNPKDYGENAASLGRPTLERIGRTISKIGKAAGVRVVVRKYAVPRRVKVSRGQGRKAGYKLTDEVVKYATAHDLRRSFCVRWSLEVECPTLMEMARHDSIETTQKYYLGRNAELAARQAWAAFNRRDKGNKNAG